MVAVTPPQIPRKAKCCAEGSGDCSDPLPLFLFGESSIDCRRWYIPAVIPFQKYVWFIFGPPTTTTILFIVQIIYYVIARKKYTDMLFVILYFVRFGCQYGPYLGWSGCVKLNFATRVLETQSSSFAHFQG